MNWSSIRMIAAASVLCVSPISNRANAVSIDWIRQLGTSGEDFSAGVATGATGNIYTAATLGNPYGDGLPDAVLTKYDPSGNPLWKRQVGTSSWDIAGGVVVDEHGGIYITGATAGKLGAARFANTDCFVSKFDATGNLQWTSQFAPGATLLSGLYTRGISADGMGGLYVTGYSLASSTSFDSDIYVAKLDTAGNLLWTRQFGSNVDDKSFAVTSDGLGNVYITGDTYGSVGGPHVGTVGTDAFITKMDGAGNVVWNRQLGLMYSDYGFAAGADGIGNVYISGATQGDLGGEYAGGFHDAFVAKYDTNGNVAWIRQIGGDGADEAYGLFVDPNGGIVITGNSDELTGERPARIGNSFVAKYNDAGNLLWAEELGVAGAKSISIDSFGGLYVSGETYENFNGPNAGIQDAFLMRIESVPEPCALSLEMLAATLVCGIRCRAKRQALFRPRRNWGKRKPPVIDRGLNAIVDSRVSWAPINTCHPCRRGRGRRRPFCLSWGLRRLGRRR
jgi:hypothetical protein